MRQRPTSSASDVAQACTLAPWIDRANTARILFRAVKLASRREMGVFFAKKATSDTRKEALICARAVEDSGRLAKRVI